MTTVAIRIDLEHATPLPFTFSDWPNIYNSNLADLAI